MMLDAHDSEALKKAEALSRAIRNDLDTATSLDEMTQTVVGVLLEDRSTNDALVLACRYIVLLEMSHLPNKE